MFMDLLFRGWTPDFGKDENRLNMVVLVKC
jgi:hypothetical protein